jgi:hypothetical protein
LISRLFGEESGYIIPVTVPIDIRLGKKILSFLLLKKSKSLSGIVTEAIPVISRLANASDEEVKNFLLSAGLAAS